MLVVFKGESEFVHFFTSNLVKKWATKNNVHLVGMTSHSGTYIIDGEGEDQHFRINENYKDEFRLHVDESSESRIKRQMIIGHIDMIAEGINIPSLLAILPLRDLGEIKAAHTMGRAMRLLVIDRRNFYAGKIKLKEIKQGKKMIKPYAWVIIPLYSWQHEDSHNRLVNMARRMKNELGYNPVETVPGGECGSGRIEGFRKDSHQLSSEVDSLDIVHEVDNPEFEARKEYEKNRMRKDPKAFRKMIKYTASG